MKLKSVALAIAAVAGLALGGTAAKANSIEITTVSVSSSGGFWNYVYSLSLTAPNQIDNTSAKVVFYDINGLVTGDVLHPIVESLAGTWTVPIVETFTAPMTADSGTGVPAHDDLRPNIRVEYTDATVMQNPGPGSIPLGTLSFWSIFGPQAGQLPMIAIDRTIDPGTLAAGGTKYNSDLALGPAVPVPAAAWMGLTTLAGLAGLGVLRRRRSA